MSIAICNDCNELVVWRKAPRSYIKNQQCQCGSKNLSAVYGRWKPDMSGMYYYDRHGNLRKYVSRDTSPTIKTTINGNVTDQKERCT